MSISERIENTIERWSGQWKDRLLGWMAAWLNRGVTAMFEAQEPGLKDLARAQYEQIKANPEVPQELKDQLDHAMKAGNILETIFIEITIILGTFGVLLGGSQPLARILMYYQDREKRSFRLEPSTLTNVWRRDKAAYEKYFDDLRDLGFSEDRIEVIKELAKILPPLADMVRFADFSAFDPEVIEKWKQYYDAPDWISGPMSLIGITNEAPRDWANKYWFSHWIQPGRFELGEMYRRGLMGTPLVGQDEIGAGPTEGEAEETIKLAYRTMGYSPFWQDRLLQLVREVPTRVDVRRWWDMRTIDETELRDIYRRRGYFGKDLENYVLWTKVYVAFPDLMARYSNGWVTLEDVRGKLVALGMPADRVDELIQTKVKPSEPARTESEKTLTKTEIYKGVKKELITWDQGVELLMDLGYDEDEADYILAINVEVLEGSPEKFEDFKDLTHKYKVATGREEKPMPEELKAKADELVRVKLEVEALDRAIKEEERQLVAGEPLPEAAESKLKELQVTRNRALAELQRIQTEYNSLVAQWKHGVS